MNRARNLCRAALIAGLFLTAGTVYADRVYQQPDAFVRDAFDSTPPAPTVLWLTGAAKDSARAILGHDYPALRLRYWGGKTPAGAGRTVWVLDEVGKEAPITVGVIVEGNRIEKMRVLVFRESRGWEVETPAFMRQFVGARLKSDSAAAPLDRTIDGISGATLSVRALTKLSRLALALHRQTPYSQ